MTTPPNQRTIRCPACDGMFQDWTPRQRPIRSCAFCGSEVAEDKLVRGPDDVWGVRPEPLSGVWNGRVLAVYPDGSRSDLDLGGVGLRPGDRIPGKTFAIERWDVTDRPVEGGRFGVVAILRAAPGATE
jgi:hypothetical protein